MVNRGLRLTREFFRMKQAELASKLEISASYLSEIEAGKKPVSVDLLQRYADVFDIPASTFLLLSEKTPGEITERRQRRAKRLLDFLEWVADEEDNKAAT